MSRLVCLLVSFCLFCFALPAYADSVRELSLQFETSIRQDEINWNIANPDGTANVWSELEWENLEIYEISFSGLMIVGNNTAPFATYLRSKFNYGWIVDGDVQDSDYVAHNRTNERSRSNSDANDGNVLDFSIAVGPQFKWFSDNFFIAPLIGYSYHEQNLVMKNGIQTVSDYGFSIPVGTIHSELDSSYDTEWSSAWIGTDMSWHIGDKLIVNSSLEYHWHVDYNADAEWNLRNLHFHQANNEDKRIYETTEAKGFAFNLSLQYSLNNNWSLNFGAAYQKWSVKDGTDQIDGDPSNKILNEVNWKSTKATIGVTYNFY